MHSGGLWTYHESLPGGFKTHHSIFVDCFLDNQLKTFTSRSIRGIRPQKRESPENKRRIYNETVGETDFLYGIQPDCDQWPSEANSNILGSRTAWIQHSNPSLRAAAEESSPGQGPAPHSLTSTMSTSRILLSTPQTLRLRPSW